MYSLLYSTSPSETLVQLLSCVKGMALSTTKAFPGTTWEFFSKSCDPQKKWAHLAVCQNLVPLVNIKIAGKWMFIPLKMVLIGIDPYPFGWLSCFKLLDISRFEQKMHSFPIPKKKTRMSVLKHWCLLTFALKPLDPCLPCRPPRTCRWWVLAQCEGPDNLGPTGVE